MANHKKVYLLLLLIVLLAGFLFYKQIVRTSQINVQHTVTPLISSDVTFIPDSASDEILGNPGAALTVTEFMDLGCARCLALHSTIENFVNKHPLNLRLIWKDNTKAGLFSDFTLAHQAAFCAGQQDKFWQFMDIAIANRTNLGETGLKKIALGLNLNFDKWWQCAGSAQTKKNIADAAILADQLKIRSLPAIFINNKLINTGKEIDIEQMLTNFIAK